MRMDAEEIVRMLLQMAVGVLIGLAICVGITLLSGCGSVEYVPVENVRTEVKENVREVHDTVTTADTRVVYVKGDTVVDVRYRERLQTVWRHDTLWYVRTDSVAVPYPVERELTAWERVKTDWSVCVVAALTAGMVIVIWLVRRNPKA